MAVFVLFSMRARQFMFASRQICILFSMGYRLNTFLFLDQQTLLNAVHFTDTKKVE